MDSRSWEEDFKCCCLGWYREISSCDNTYKATDRLLRQIETYGRYELSPISSSRRHAFVEQRNVKLVWYTTTSSVISKGVNNITPYSDQKNSKRLQQEHKQWFAEIWGRERRSNRKLTFYNEIKNTFGLEPYLQILAKLRTSSHQLKIETGRYNGAKRSSPIHRVWEFCSTEDKDVLTHLAELPFLDMILEDKMHVLVVCPRYHVWTTP